MTAAAGIHDFVAVQTPPRRPRRRAATRPDSNTGLNPQTPKREGFALGVDYCTLVFPIDEAERQQLVTAPDLVDFLFWRAPLTTSQLEAKKWQFYAESAYIYGPDGKIVGRVGVGSNGGTVCVSLTGAGCSLVDNWMSVQVQARRLHAHLSRVDLAFDDFDSAIFTDIREVNSWALAGRFDAKTGRPADTYMLDDHHKGKGSTVYVGSRGRKQLCIYEKGKQLGDRESRWIRCELRLWAADVVIPLEVLTDPLGYLRGAYAVLSELLPAEAEPAKPERIARTVEASAVAALRFLRNQCGPTLDLLVSSIGPDVWFLLRDQVLRSDMPRRFKGIAPNLSALRTIVRDQLGYGPSLSHQIAV